MKKLLTKKKKPYQTKTNMHTPKMCKKPEFQGLFKK